MKKFYVVWKGRVPGVYDNINDMLEQVENYPGATFRGYNSSEEATRAFRRGTLQEDKKDLASLLLKSQRSNMPASGASDPLSNPEIDPNAWVVDAACSGNPGKMEYRGVELLTGRELFHVGPFEESTNNIGEFLAIVHAMSLMYARGENHTIYTDSKTGMSWVRNRKVKTKLERTPRTERSFQLMERALSWLNTHHHNFKVIKWETDRWGEIPADFGRK